MPNVLLNRVVLLHESPFSDTGSTLASPASDPVREDSPPWVRRNEAVQITSCLARLPYRDSSVDVISARSLHKAIRAGGGLVVHPSEQLRECLKECHRVLVPGGRLEYIYFGDQLHCCGPLTGELEAVLWEVWTQDNAGGQGQGPPTDDFATLLDQAGFKDGKHLTMKFGLFRLRSLFNYKGVQRRQRTGAATLKKEEQQLGSQQPASPSPVGPKDWIDQKAHELLFQVYKECALRETGWECVIGYVTKRVK
jgi:SAM-dependent methyltransferase